MIIKTKTLGEIDINENEIITVIDGIFGFPDLTKYILLMKEEEAPFAWFQSVEDSELAFVVIDPFLFKHKYKLKVGKDFLNKIQVSDNSEIISYSIVVIPQNNPQMMTANLQGPLIINPKNKLACQAISDIQEYGVRHLIMEEFKEKQAKEGK
ncbi:MAG TPA: flagellar assembly protein FliW [bacterium]|nr:flagellar assembly protein FliW [bacterium]HPN30275.1 flagellar assembly protein FliW [bacterium]